MQSKTKPDEKKVEESVEVMDFSKPDFIFVPGGYHAWRQRGPYLVCTSCDLSHAVHIGMQKVLTGIDKDGKPLLKNRTNSPSQ